MNIGGNVKSSSIKVKGKGGFFEDAGGSIGNFLGKKAGGLLSSIFGVGDYKVKHNSLMNASNPPLIVNSPSGTIIRHREYICDILSSTGFTLTSYPINPGISTTFPWLAGVAQSFEQYEARGIIFDYKSLSGDALNSTNTALGTVIMVTEYDSSKPVFTDKRSMENYTYSTNTTPSNDAMHPVECAGDVTPLRTMYVRNSGVVPSTDLRFSDMGLFQVATQGFQASGFIAGELWVTYEIEFLKPRLPPTISSNPPIHYTYDSSLFVSSAGPPTSANLFGIPVQKLFLRGVGATTVTLSANSILFAATGTYFVYLSLGGSAAVVGALNAPVIGSGTALGTGSFITTMFSVGGTLASTIQTPGSGTNTSTLAVVYAINVTTATSSQPCQVSYPTVTLPVTITACDLVIAPLPQGFTSPRTTVERDELYMMMSALLRERHLELEYDDVDIPTSTPAELARCVPALSQAPPAA
jgi:hypothetical protein